MKKFFLVLTAVLILSTGFVVVAARQGATVEQNRRHVGATIKPYALNTPEKDRSAQAIPAQLSLIQELNGSIIRMNTEPEMATNDALINAAHEAGLDILLVMEEGENPVHNAELSIDELEKLGYETGLKYATRYKGKVKYYQLANEVSGTAVTQPGEEGPTIPNRYGITYNKARYERVRAHTEGLSRGVAAADPTAKRVVTGHWVLIDVVKELIDDGVDFEIVGWDWYSDMGADPGKKLVDDQPTLDFPATVNDWGKEFWLVELNKESGSYDKTAAEQSAYLAEVAEIRENDERIRGLIVHMLTDQVYAQSIDDKIGWLGIVEVKQQGREWVIGAKKPAFAALAPIFARINAQTPALSAWDQFTQSTYNYLESLK